MKRKGPIKSSERFWKDDISIEHIDGVYEYYMHKKLVDKK